MLKYDADIDPNIRLHLNNLGLATQGLRSSLLSHPVYTRIDDIASLRGFMKSHVFAVWDFMTLLKSLQRSITCVDLPWVPPKDRICARLINDIVLEEETDEPSKGSYISHLELYLDAMKEVGAETRPILEVIEGIKAGKAVGELLNAAPVPESTRNFSRITLALAAEPPHMVASAFLLGRESIIPAMFRRILGEVNERGDRWSRVVGVVRRRFRMVDQYPNLRLYLDRHIHLDGGDHTPMGERLLMVLCGNDKQKWDEAAQAARRALEARIELWNGVLREVGK
jgi:hypothetical protein